jgi:hypothetical protein
MSYARFAETVLLEGLFDTIATAGRPLIKLGKTALNTGLSKMSGILGRTARVGEETGSTLGAIKPNIGGFPKPYQGPTTPFGKALNTGLGVAPLAPVGIKMMKRPKPKPVGAY